MNIHFTYPQFCRLSNFLLAQRFSKKDAKSLNFFCFTGKTVFLFDSRFSCLLNIFCLGLFSLVCSPRSLSSLRLQTRARSDVGKFFNFVFQSFSFAACVLFLCCYRVKAHFIHMLLDTRKIWFFFIHNFYIIMLYMYMNTHHVDFIMCRPARLNQFSMLLASLPIHVVLIRVYNCWMEESTQKRKNESVTAMGSWEAEIVKHLRCGIWKAHKFSSKGKSFFICFESLSNVGRWKISGFREWCVRRIEWSWLAWGEQYLAPLFASHFNTKSLNVGVEASQPAAMKSTTWEQWMKNSFFNSIF